MEILAPIDFLATKNPKVIDTKAVTNNVFIIPKTSSKELSAKFLQLQDKVHNTKFYFFVTLASQLKKIDFARKVSSYQSVSILSQRPPLLRKI